MSYKYIKNEIIPIRVSKKEKEQIERKALKCNKSTSSYIRDSAVAGLERKRDKDKKQLRSMIESQELLNDISLLMDDQNHCSSQLKSKLEELMKGELRLWLN